MNSEFDFSDYEYHEKKVKMKNFKNIANRLIVSALVFLIFLPFLYLPIHAYLFANQEHDSFGNSDNLFLDFPDIPIVNIEDAENEKMAWTDVAQEVIPSVAYIQTYDPESGETGSGSGVILTDDGFIITNAHVIEGREDYIQVKIAEDFNQSISDVPSYDAMMIGADYHRDIALIKIESSNTLSPAEFGNSDEILIAQGSMAIGFPGGIDMLPSASVTIGHISATNRPIEMGHGYIVNSIQTDTAISPGNSGGALVNEYGQIIGIPTAKIVGQGYEGLGFAIPSNLAIGLLENLVEYGHPDDIATIGVSGIIRDELDTYLKDLPAAGMEIHEIASQFLMDAGVEVGDILTHLEGVPATSRKNILGVLQTKNPGDLIELEIYKKEYEESSLITIELVNYYDIF